MSAQGAERYAFIEIDAEGYYGDYATVWGVHGPERARTLAKRRGPSVQIIDCKGPTDHRVREKIARAVIREMIAAGRWAVVL